MAVVELRTISCFIFSLSLVANAQYTDDSDYNDIDFYEDMQMGYTTNFGKNQRSTIQDDFYIISEFDEADTQNGMYPMPNDLSIPFENENHLKRRNSFAGQLNWYKPEKVYRYTKHRIPGYDYEELDYPAQRPFQECDDRSVWTHCLCQFTCEERDVVDCYTPCKSGCECREEYVFDEKTQQCQLPENCSPKEENFVYE